MSCIVLITCFVFMVLRLRRGATALVPATLCLLALLSLVLAFLGLTRVFFDIAHVAPADKAAFLSNGISEMMNALVIRDFVALPLLLVGGYFLDRRLRRRRQVPVDPAHAAPEGGRCANHPDQRASIVCPRCGTFVCDACTAVDLKLCASCAPRHAPPA